MKHTIRAAAVLASAAPALAQEAMYTEAATMPSPGTFVLREMFHYSVYGANPQTGTERTHRYEWLHSLQVGLARDLSLKIDLPVEWRTDERPDALGGDDFDKGIGGVDLMLKWRFLKQDTGGIDTLRGALLLGMDIPTGDDDFGPKTVNPYFGGVITKVWGRHGFNQDVMYHWNTSGSEDHNFGGEGPDNAVLHNSAYLFRFYPERYEPTTTGAWYATIELSGIYETNGDYELRWAPGIMYEGRLFALEFMLQLPLYHDLDHRPELDLRVGFGVRFAF